MKECVRQLLPLETPCLLAAAVGLKHHNLGPESRFPEKQGCSVLIQFSAHEETGIDTTMELKSFFFLHALHHSVENK